MIDNINFKRNSYGTDQERVNFLQYVMDHPILGLSFVEHDAEKALKENMMVRDLSKLPSNVMMFCLILTRALWEIYQGNLISRFSKLCEHGFNDNEAFILSNFITVDTDGKLKFSPLPDSGHNAISTATFTCEGLANYVNAKIIHQTEGTILEGFGTQGANGVCVNNVFCPFTYDEWHIPKAGRTHSLSKWLKTNINDDLIESVKTLIKNSGEIK